MAILSAENEFKRGLAALVDERHADALEFFRSALQIETHRSVREPAARYLSYYGLALARMQRVAPEAIEACESAVRREPLDPTLLLNLGRVYALAGKSAKADACFREAARPAAAHQAADRRRRPVMAGLARSNPLNRWLGTLRSRFSTRGSERAVPRGTTASTGL